MTRSLEGQVAEVWVYDNLDSFLNKFFEDTGISKNVEVKKHDWAGYEGPDMQLKATQDITDKYGNIFKKGEIIAIVEVKSTTTHSLDAFEKQIGKGRTQISREVANLGMHGILIVLDYDIWLSSEKGLSMPDRIGDYNNPYVVIMLGGG
ncbi:MAG: hypothetical protein FGF53_04810 [Candidatus Brockarchaeota archaeon]|nr:hypothetical protein [Candidatus Brockarchaeota archaeon]MBO3808763.1 hypothetical protein [Candidatus Brockarchaeota archaeon]